MSQQVEMWKFFENIDLTNFTVIIPSVAVGNVAQLACDLIISTLRMKKVASIYSPAIVPTVGYNPYDLLSDQLMCSCDLNVNTRKLLAVLQFRAPLIQKNSEKFLEGVVKTFKEKSVKEIIILTSSFAHEKKAVSTSPFRYIANEYSTRKELISSLSWQEHERQDNEFIIHGGGFAIILYNICTKLKLPTVLLFKYCSEGDNTPDAKDMTLFVNDLLNFVEGESKLLEPISWQYLFGKPPPGEIY